MKNLLTDLLPFASNAEVCGKRLLTHPPYVNRIRARLLPQLNRTSGLFAPDTISWLRSCATETTFSDNGRESLNQTGVFTLPIIGITNRPLPGYRKSGFNLFKTIATITASDDVKNLDQCIVEFSPRLPVTSKDFNDELSRQICMTGCSIKKKVRLAFYAHNVCNAAFISDLEALRLCALKIMPIINIDWLDIESSWDVMWNPCSNLKPVRKKIEAQLIGFLDQIIEQVCASRCKVIISAPGSFIDSTYLPYRDRQNLPALNISKTISVANLCP